MPVPNQAQLITYPDSFGGDLSTLNNLLVKHFQGVFRGVHILPPFPSTGDRGFAPTTYFEIEPRFGDWDDIRRIGGRFDVLVDLMVNHISRQSVYFQDFSRQGRRSNWAGLFITLDKVWPGGIPRQEDVARIFLRRPLHPFADIRIEETGETERVWATFGGLDWSEQIDVDVHSPEARGLFREILAHFSRNGVRMVRLDAVAYVNKKPGTNCFFIEPDLWEFLDWIGETAAQVGIELLPEVHAHHTLLQKMAEHGNWVYNFALPLLVLHTLVNRSSAALKDHLRTCPRRQFTNLDTHDGIPVQPDVNDLIAIDDSQAVVQHCLDRGGNLSRIFSEEHRLRPDYDAHQINITYYSALDADDDAYLAARAIQFFTPGLPQVYYVGLLAGENDPEAFERQNDLRAINRHNYTAPEIEAALERPVVRRLLDLIRFRNEFPAFQGEFSVLDSDDGSLRLSWELGESACTLAVDLVSRRAEIEIDEAGAVWGFIP